MPSVPVTPLRLVLDPFAVVIVPVTVAPANGTLPSLATKTVIVTVWRSAKMAPSAGLMKVTVSAPGMGVTVGVGGVGVGGVGVGGVGVGGVGVGSAWAASAWAVCRLLGRSGRQLPLPGRIQINYLVQPRPGRAQWPAMPGEFAYGSTKGWRTRSRRPQRLHAASPSKCRPRIRNRWGTARAGCKRQWHLRRFYWQPGIARFPGSWKRR